MIRNHRFAIAAMGVLLTIGVAACSNPAAENTSIASSGKPAALPDSCSQDKPVLGVSLPNTVNPYYTAMRQSFIENGTKAGFDVKVAIANDNDSNQLSQVQAFIQQGVCMVALNGVNSGPAASAVAALNRANIPVFTVNVIVSSDDLKRQNASFVQYVGPDQVEGGQKMGEAVLEDLGKDAKIVAGIAGDPDQIPTNQRDQGFTQALSSNPNAKVVTTVNTKVDPNISLQVVTEMLQGNPDINVVFADTGPGAVGSIQAIKQLKREGKVSLYAFCAADTALDSTLYRGCAAQEPAMYAKIVVESAAKYRNGETVEPEILLPVKVFTEGQKPAAGEVG